MSSKNWNWTKSFFHHRNEAIRYRKNHRIVSVSGRDTVPIEESYAPLAVALIGPRKSLEITPSRTSKTTRQRLPPINGVPSMDQSGEPTAMGSHGSTDPSLPIASFESTTVKLDVAPSPVSLGQRRRSHPSPKSVPRRTERNQKN